MKIWIVAMTLAGVTLGVTFPARAYWESYTAYRTEDIYGNVDVATTYTVSVPDYGWVDQGVARSRVVLASTNGSVVVRSIPATELSRMSSSGSRSTSAGTGIGLVRGNMSSASRRLILTGLKPREVVSASSAKVSTPAVSKNRQGGGTISNGNKGRGDDKKNQKSGHRNDKD